MRRTDQDFLSRRRRPDRRLKDTLAFCLNKSGPSVLEGPEETKSRTGSRCRLVLTSKLPSGHTEAETPEE